jgi:uncharacterized protein YjbI with pentapeptide repeats
MNIDRRRLPFSATALAITTPRSVNDHTSANDFLSRENRAKLRHCPISSTTFFSSDCTGTDFSHTEFSDVRMKGCNLSGACFRNAEFERWMIPS